MSETTSGRSRASNVVALAKYPNVSVKLSSAPTYSLEDYPWRDMTEHLKRCFDAFVTPHQKWKVRPSALALLRLMISTLIGASSLNRRGFANVNGFL